MQSKSRIHADSPLPDDQFDRLPDPIVLLILNNVADVRSLGRCSAISKRFSSLVPLVHHVFVKIDRVVTVDGDPSDDPLHLSSSSSSSSSKPRTLFSHLLKFLLLAILKPFHHLHTSSSSSGSLKPLLPQLSHHSPAQVLKQFAHLRHLRIELPAGDVPTEDGVVLKWRAEFGSTLESCVILGGTRIDQQPSPSSGEDDGSIPESFYTNGGLKLRVVWTISSLIAASTRHYLLKPIIEEHPTLRSLVLSDADGQGTLVMGAEQLREFREKPIAASASANRTQVPASNMKLRYAPYLELPEGVGMQGATLVAIRPSSSSSGGDGCVAGGGGGGGNGGGRKEIEAFVSGAFEGPFRAAVKALLKRRTYLLEMNGF